MDIQPLNPEQTKKIQKAKLILWLGLSAIMLIGMLIVFYFMLAQKAVAPTLNENTNTELNTAMNFNGNISMSNINIMQKSDWS